MRPRAEHHAKAKTSRGDPEQSVREIQQTSPELLKEMDRELLLSIKRTLQEHKREVDKMLSRLSFVDEQQLN